MVGERHENRYTQVGASAPRLGDLATHDAARNTLSVTNRPSTAAVPLRRCCALAARYALRASRIDPELAERERDRDEPQLALRARP